MAAKLYVVGAMYRMIALIILLCLAACAANRTPGSPNYVYSIGYESGCARGYVEANEPPWPLVRSSPPLYASDQLFHEGWQNGHTRCVIDSLAS